ncbi:uncharacterized protein [Lepeophtheirus salmonis]|uniref:uncharacterized protein isoform X1 n=1 Tax=Lepeophtheirus salmonis TaxID=72036 RepID=UPI003AF3E41D
MPKVDVELSDLDSNSNNSDVFSHQTKINDEISTNRSNNDDTDVSSSHSVFSSHAMKMGFYQINLGTKNGQRLHSIHMLILPLIPVGILLGQNTSNYISHSSSANEIKNVEQQVNQALDLSSLVQRLQEERAAVALNIFTETEVKNFEYLQNYTTINISEFSLVTTFDKTDTILQNIKNWPQIEWVNYFDTKLKFQIQHSIFRTKIRGGEATIFEVIDWYNQITSFLLTYISYSIHDSDVSDFYRYIISFKNILRSLEYASKTGGLWSPLFHNGKS